MKNSFFDDVTEIESTEGILKPVKVPSLFKKAITTEENAEEITTIDHPVSSSTEMALREYFNQLAAFLIKATNKVRELFNPSTSWDHKD